MSSNLTYKHNYINFGKQVLRSEGMAKVMQEAGFMVQNRCGKGYVMRQKLGNNRQMAIVVAVTREANEDNALHNTLLKALY